MSKKTKEEYEREIATIDGIMKCVCRFAQTSSTDKEDMLQSDWFIEYKEYLLGRMEKVDRKIAKLNRISKKKIMQTSALCGLFFFVSSFYDAETLVSILQDAIYYKAKEISNWITSEKIDFKEPQNYHTLAFTLDMGDDPVGHGITIDGRELATTMTTVVLQRDFSDESPFGFFVKTAYVDIFHERAEETGLRVNIPDFIQNKIPFTSNIEKAYHCLKHEYPDKKIWLQNNKGNSEIKISEDNGDNKYIAYISELGTKIKKAEIDHIRTASSLECYLECPKLTEMLTYADNVTHNRNITQSKKQDITH